MGRISVAVCSTFAHDYRPGRSHAVGSGFPGAVLGDFLLAAADKTGDVYLVANRADRRGFVGPKQWSGRSFERFGVGVARVRLVGFGANGPSQT